MAKLDLSDWFTLTEAAAFLGLSVGRVSVIVKGGKLPHTPFGRQRMILKADAAAFKKQNRPVGRPHKKTPKPS